MTNQFTAVFYRSRGGDFCVTGRHDQFPWVYRDVHLEPETIQSNASRRKTSLRISKHCEQKQRQSYEGCSRRDNDHAGHLFGFAFVLLGE